MFFFEFDNIYAMYLAQVTVFSDCGRLKFRQRRNLDTLKKSTYFRRKEFPRKIKGPLKTFSEKVSSPGRKAPVVFANSFCLSCESLANSVLTAHLRGAFAEFTPAE